MVAYEDHVHRTVHLAFVRGELSGEPLVRVHLTETLRDTAGVRAEELGWPLADAMRRIAAEGNGVVVLLRGEESPRELVDSLSLLGSGTRKRTGPVLRTYGIGAQILSDLGVSRMRVLSRYTHLQGLAAFGLTITEYVPTGALEVPEEPTA